jgi:nitrate/nitrite-specific signal transduction histidine kinase
VFVVADDGRGIESAEPAGGVGLQIMRYRARMLGGLLDVERGARGGTRVRCVVPTASARNE